MCSSGVQVTAFIMVDVTKIYTWQDHDVGRAMFWKFRSYSFKTPAINIFDQHPIVWLCGVLVCAFSLVAVTKIYIVNSLQISKATLQVIHCSVFQALGII